MRYTLGSYFSIGLIQPGTIARSVKLDVAFAAKTRGRTRARARKTERESARERENERKQIAIGKKGEKIYSYARARKRLSAPPEIGRPTSSTVLLATARPSQSATGARERGGRERRGSVVGRRCDKVTEWKRRRIMRHRKPNIVPRWQRGNSAVGSLIGKG